MPRARASIGYVPEFPQLYDYLTAREMISFVADIRGRGEACALSFGVRARGERVETGSDQGVTIDDPLLAAIKANHKSKLASLVLSSNLISSLGAMEMANALADGSTTSVYHYEIAKLGPPGPADHLFGGVQQALAGVMLAHFRDHSRAL